jgi:hypothetical protein
MRPIFTSSRHPLRATILVAGLGLLMLAACSPSHPENNGSSPAGSDSQALVKPPQLGEVAAEPAISDSGKSAGIRRPPVQGTTGSINGTIPVKARRGVAASESLTVGTFLDKSFDAGQRVQIAGTCLDQFHTNASAGPPPVSRSDWQLSSGTRVVYVVGRMPASCATGPVTISATVSIDTTMIAGQRRPRRFLTISR